MQFDQANNSNYLIISIFETQYYNDDVCKKRNEKNELKNKKKEWRLQPRQELGGPVGGALMP